jgi:branched-chain amino acid aminotransferase
VHRAGVPRDEPLAWLRGRWMAASQAALPLYDLGLQGMAVTETVRTFGHVLFRLEDHLDRLERSLELAWILPEITRAELGAIASELVARNTRLIAPEDELGLTMFVTAGWNPTYVGASAGAECGRPTVGLHTWRLPLELWAERARTGQHLATPEVRQVPAETLDPRIKSRSRLHWHVAERQARAVDPHATAVLLDRDGFMTETATANFFAAREGVLLTPRVGTTLEGVSQKIVRELADRLGVAYHETDLRPEDVYAADEAFTSSTPYCLLPAVRLNGKTIGSGRPGPVYERLMRAWSELVGVDLATRSGDSDPGRL